MNKKQILLWSIIGTIVIIAISLVLIGKQLGTGAVVYEPKTVKLAINPFPNSALIHIAQEKGYFKEQGLNIEYHSFPTGKLALDALIGGGADIATTADVPIALAGLAKQEISVIATIEYSKDNVQVVARKDKGISKPSDLQGKKIATTKGGGPMFFTHKFLEKYALEVSDVSIVFLTPSEMVTAIIKGDVDAFIVFEPYPYLAIKEIGKDNVAVFHDSDLYGESWNIVVMDDYGKTNPETITKFLKALIKAEKFYKKNYDESLVIISKYSGTEMPVLAEMMKRQTIGVVLNNVLLDYLNQEAIWAKEKGLVSNDAEIPNYMDYINPEYLKEIDSKAVEI